METIVLTDATRNATARLAEKVAVVTGSSRGIGRAIAERLARDGASVVVNYWQHREKAGDVVSAIEAAGGKAHAVQADVSEAAQVRRLFQATVDRFGRLDILVTNAGILRWGVVSELTEEDYDTVFRLNAKGTFFAMQEAARRIEDGGRIINVSSSATAMSIPGLALYVGSKAAGEQFARTLAKELGPRNVTVNTISPGFTVTDMLPEDAEYRKRAVELSILGRLGQPADIADVVAFLASDEARWITGQIIEVDGGVAT